MALKDGAERLPVWNSLVVLLISCIILRALYNIYLHPLSKIPGPSVWSATRLPFVSALLRGTIVHRIQGFHRQYGPVVRVAPNEVACAHTDAWNDILKARSGQQQFLKDPVWWSPHFGMPMNLVTAIDPDTHTRIRNLIKSGFTSRSLRLQEPFLHRYVDLLVERLREQVGVGQDDCTEVDMVPWFNFTTFDIFGDLGFGESFDCLQESSYHPWIALLFQSVKAATFLAAVRFYPLLDFALIRCIPPSLKKMSDNHYKQIVDKVERRLNFELRRPDIMSYVIEGLHDQELLPMGEIHSTFMLLTTAGSETTATVLSGTLNYLVANTEKMITLEKEVRGLFDRLEDITLDSLRNLPYLNAVIAEGLRLCPPIPWILPRVVPPGGANVCGAWLPGGTKVSIQAYTLYRDPSRFHLASEFLPERWLPEASADASSPFFKDEHSAVQPFSIGPHACLGVNLAWAEMRLILSKLLFTFDFRARNAKQVLWEELRTFALIEKQPIVVTMRKRMS